MRPGDWREGGVYFYGLLACLHFAACQRAERILPVKESSSVWVAAAC